MRRSRRKANTEPQSHGDRHGEDSNTTDPRSGSLTTKEPEKYKPCDLWLLRFSGSFVVSAPLAPPVRVSCFLRVVSVSSCLRVAFLRRLRDLPRSLVTGRTRKQRVGVARGLHVALRVLLEQEALLDEPARGVLDGADESVLAAIPLFE